ncbi:hypothetical protein ACA910_016140 [Epithemia clementina (nom. ined.)]
MNATTTSKVKPVVRLVPFPVYKEGDSDPFDEDDDDNDFVMIANEVDDYALAYEELVDNKDDEELDRWWGFALSLIFAGVAMHMWGKMCLSYLAWYPACAVALLLILVLFSGWLYKFLEGPEEDDENVFDDVADQNAGGVATKSLIRAATVLCARYPHYEEDDLLSCTASVNGGSLGSSSDESDEDSSCLSIGHSEESSQQQGHCMAPVAGQQQERSSAGSKQIKASGLPPLTTVTAVTSTLSSQPSPPRFHRRRKRVRFDVSIESKIQRPVFNEKENNELWYSKKELRDLRRNLVFVDTENAVAAVSPLNWWRLFQFLTRLSSSKPPRSLSPGAGRRKFFPSKVVEDWILLFNEKKRRRCYAFRERQRWLIQMRARLAVTYAQVDGVVGLERHLVQYHEEACSQFCSTKTVTSEESDERDSVLDYIRREKDANKIAAFQRKISRPSCLFAHEIAVAQACALELS